MTRPDSKDVLLRLHPLRDCYCPSLSSVCPGLRPPGHSLMGRSPLSPTQLLCVRLWDAAVDRAREPATCWARTSAAKGGGPCGHGSSSNCGPGHLRTPPGPGRQVGPGRRWVGVEEAGGGAPSRGSVCSVWGRHGGGVGRAQGGTCTPGRGPLNTFPTSIPPERRRSRLLTRTQPPELEKDSKLSKTANRADAHEGLPQAGNARCRCFSHPPQLRTRPNKGRGLPRQPPTHGAGPALAQGTRGS